FLFTHLLVEVSVLFIYLHLSGLHTTWYRDAFPRDLQPPPPPRAHRTHPPAPHLSVFPRGAPCTPSTPPQMPMFSHHRADT
ncbi:hypothetical protein EMIHUDRAFT_368475, partial [Emiliania huxleyi CCMP1516]|uniref:Uncharacterized protein n=2 Tax=Emiliania huxleyi TaxID=2903 RepID=A0A0D3JEW6_EMIH1